MFAGGYLKQNNKNHTVMYKIYFISRQHSASGKLFSPSLYHNDLWTFTALSVWVTSIILTTFLVT
jgi:hypothetical protein